MSKPMLKSHRHEKDGVRSGVKSHAGTEIILIVLAVIFASIPFGLGKYFELNSPGPFDSGAYVYSAAHILDGAEIGVEEKPSAQPGTLLMNILGVWLFGFSDFGPKIIQGILQAAALVLMFIAMRKLFCTLAATIGVIVASVFLSAPLIAKFGNVKEQYMIAFMIMGISSFVLGQVTGKKIWTVLSGAFLIWGPLFKATGMSAPGALGLFLIAQPILGNRTIKETVVDIGLVVLGAVISILPLYIWIFAGDIQMTLPYSFVFTTIAKLLPSASETGAQGGGYVETGRSLVPFSQQWPMVLRYYKLMILPITLAVVSILARLIIWRRAKFNKGVKDKTAGMGRFVLLFGLWWFFDMAFVWISPRSYEQYYLPLNASAAMLGGYIVTLYWRKLSSDNKSRWVVVGAVGLLIMILMSWHIFFGIETSPYSGTKYPQKQKGYSQKYEEISARKEKGSKGAWEAVGDYIRTHSDPNDKIYVWGWYPGIYVQAQRFSSASKAFMMPRPAPDVLAENIEQLLAEFRKEMPKFIVDSRKRHIPTDRPPYELWPIAPQGFMGLRESAFLPLNQQIIDQYDKQWANLLRERFGDDEADRYEALKPFRDFVMQNYRRVGMFGPHVLFQLKDS